MHVGYARVSTEEQQPDLQIIALKKAEAEIIYTEKQSGASKNRPELKKCLNYLTENDTLVIYSLDRLGRSAIEVIKIAQDLQKRKINLISIKDNIDTSTPHGKFVFQLTAILAELERDLIIQRTKDGLHAARSRGRYGGRPKLLSSKDIEQVKKLHASGIIPISDLSKRYGISKTTLYAYINPDKYRKPIKYPKISV